MQQPFSTQFSNTEDLKDRCLKRNANLLRRILSGELKQSKSAGLKVGRVEIQEGKIVLFTDNSNQKAPEQNSAIDLERWLDKRGKNHARSSQGD